MRCGNYKVYGWDIDAESVNKVRDGGLHLDSDRNEILKEADWIITSLPNTQIVRNLFVDEGGFDMIRKDAVVCDTSTIDPVPSVELTRIARSKGKTFVDCPMSGGVPGAENATLTFMCGVENEDVYNKIKPILLTMGKNVVNCRQPGGGQIVKACNNMALAIQMLSIAEALALGEKLGMDPKLLSDVMSTATSRCWSVDTYNPIPGYLPNVPASRDYLGGFNAELVLKDLTISTNAAKDCNANVDSALLTKQKIEDICKQNPKLDLGYLFQLLRNTDFKSL